MNRTALAIVACILVCAIGMSAAPAPCTLSDHTEYDKKIREYTTQTYFSTELVDHLPLSSCVPAPDAFLHHIVGAPDVLTYVKDINAYMRLLESKSPRVKVFSIGKSEEGREMLAVVVTDEQNMAKLDRYREILAKLADPRGLSEADAQRLIAEGKPIYWMTGSIHSPETGAPEMLMELAYRMAVEETPMIQKIRRDSIVMITPVVEVDGHDRQVDIYTQRKKHPDDQPPPLIWWGHYVAHDNNRDSLGLTLALSRNILGNWLRWHPTVMHDLHESVPFLYIMTGTGPYNAWLDPIVINEWQQLAYYEVQELTKRGVIGVWTHGFYDGWAPNYLLSLANSHNGIGRFYETFGNGGAETRERTVSAGQTTREWYRPNPPLPKVKWSIRNNINMQQSGVLFGMFNLATNGQQFLTNFYLKSKRAIAKARQEGPAAWVFPASDPRPAQQARLLALLQAQGVEVSRLTKEFKAESTVDGRQSTAKPATTAAEPAKMPEERQLSTVDRRPSTEQKPSTVDRRPSTEQKAQAAFGAGSYVIRMDQPYSRLADMLLDTQYYNPRDPRSYDDTGWTLGALHNIKAVRVTDTAILDVPMDKVQDEVRAPGAVKGSGKGSPPAVYLINNNAESALATLRFRLATVKMDAAEQAFEADGVKFKPGTFIIRAAPSTALGAGLTTQLEKAAKDLGLTVYATSADVKVPTHPLATPRVALLHNWQNTQNDGWFRIALDRMSIPFTYLADTRVREAANLREQFDVIVIPPMGGLGPGGLNSLLRGLPMKGKPLAWKNSEETPNLVAPGLDSADDIRGGLGYTGLSNLEKFVRDGGLLLAVQASAAIPVQGGMTDMVNVNEARQMQAPGSVLLTNVEDKKSPIAYGYDDQLYVYFSRGPVITVGTSFGRSFGGDDQAAGRASGRGSISDPDVIQGRPYFAPEKPPKRTPREQELYITDEVREYARWLIPAPEDMPRVILRFAPDNELLLSGMIQGGQEISEKPAVVDVPHGKGHVVLFATNPMWRDETQGSYPLVFNAILNFDHLDAGREAAKPKAAAADDY